MSQTKVYKNAKAEKAIRESYDALLKMWGTDIEERDISGQYGTTHVIETGDRNKPPLVLFHGVGDDAALMWVYNAEELGRHFHIYAVDTIGGPGKSVPGEGYDKTFDDAVWISEILDKLGLDKVFMAGVSNGAYLTQMYMIQHPERVIKGISMAGVPVKTSGSGKKAAMKAMMKVFLPEALFPNDKNVMKLIRKMTGSHYSAFTENRVVFQHFKQLMTGFRRSAMMNHKVLGFTEEEIFSLSDRLLCIVGKKDPFIMLGGAQLEEELKRYPLRVEFMEDAGHGINHEKAHEVDALIIEFFGVKECVKDLL